MPQAVKKQGSGVLPPGGGSLPPAETARYTKELLDSLRKIAMRQNQEMLAHLLELARYEAQSLAQASTTTTPDSPDDGSSGPPAPAPAEP